MLGIGTGYMYLCILKYSDTRVLIPPYSRKTFTGAQVILVIHFDELVAQKSQLITKTVSGPLD